jgi:hypothetical protein
MKRSIFDEPLATAVNYWGLPQLQGETPITLSFSTDLLRQEFPDLPRNEAFQITFVHNQIKGLFFSPAIDPKRLFEFLFQYSCPTQIKVDVSTDMAGVCTVTLCLGDGVGTYLEQQENGSGYILLYYDDDFVAPYDLLETQDYHPPWIYFDRPIDANYSWLSKRQITEADVQNVDEWMLFIMYHSIYAHKGLIFYNSILELVFKQQLWYVPRYSTAQFKTEVTAQLTNIEQFNLNFLKPRFLK